MTSEFEQELTSLLNKTSAECDSDTPDFILSKFLLDCLRAFNEATSSRDAWHGFAPFGREKR